MQYLTPEEIKAIVREISNDRHKLMVLVAYNHGLRASEVINITGADIRGGHVFVRRLKGSNPTLQPFIPNTDKELDEADRLTALAGKIGPTEKLFSITRNGFYKLMRRAGEKAGIPNLKRKLCPHSLKHSCAMQLIKKKIGLEELRIFLGHSSLSSTGFYVKVSDEVASKAAIAAFNS